MSIIFFGCAAAGESAPPTAGKPGEPALIEAEEELPEEPPLEIYRYGRTFLSASEQNLYDDILEAARALRIPAEIAVGSFRVEQVEQVVRYLKSDAPELYWLETELEKPVLRLGASLPVEEIRERQGEIAAEIEWIWEWEGDDCSYLDRVHDWLIGRIVYDGSSAAPDIDNIYGGLVGKKAVCDGFARSLQFMMQQRGIPCVYVSGEDIRGLSHAWNAVELDGQWYYVDLTWDAVEPWNYIYHYCLGVTSEELELEHFRDPAQYPEVPQAEAQSGNYYIRNGYSVQAAEGDLVRQMAQAFVRQLADGYLPEEETERFLEIKVVGGPEEYEQARELYLQDPFAVLREMQEIIEREGLAIRLETGGEIRCNFRRELQILILFPLVSRG